MSGGVVIGLLFIVWSLVTFWMLRPFLRRQWRILTSRGLPPHQRFPEILHWQKGDKFDDTFRYGHYQFVLVALQEDGYAIMDFCGDRTWIPISYLVGKNTSYRTRRVNADLKNSTEYMELLNQFHVAFKQLQERDRRNGVNL